MGDKLVIGPFNRGLRNDRPPFMIDNDSFPTMINAYQWRGRVKRKRGTSLLGRLTRLFKTQDVGVTGASPWTFNLYTIFGVIKEPNASIKPGSVQIFINPVNITRPLVLSFTPNPPSAYTIANDCEVFTTTTAGLFTGDQVTIVGVTVVPNSGPNPINNTWPNVEVVSSGVSFKLRTPSNDLSQFGRWGTWLAGGTWTKIVGAITFTDNGDGTLTSSSLGNSGIIDYTTGQVSLTHTAGAGAPVDMTFAYFPGLPVMGLEDFDFSSSQFPGTIGFDTKFSYNIGTTNPFIIYDVNFYKNPATGTYPGYIQKQDGAGNPLNTPFVWNGEDYQQFWTTNYENAMWATNGIAVIFPTNTAQSQNLAMQFADKSVIAFVANTEGPPPPINPPATITVTIAASPLVVGDFVFFNEWTIGGLPATNLNFQTGYVTVAAPPLYTITLPNAHLPLGVYDPGIIQYLTNNSDPTKDCLRWYDGDPTLQNGIFGWVNFAPPLSILPFSVAELPAAQYYLIGARMILPFKDRLIFIGPVVQTSLFGSQRYLEDTVIFSQNGTPYYTASFDATLTLNPLTNAATIYHAILVPDFKTATANAYIEDAVGFGGFASAALNQPINSCSSDQDVLIMGFATLQARFVYTGNDAIPFEFYVINSELGSGSVFSAINTDSGVLSNGTRGFVLTSQTNSQRFDLEIPDQNFQISRIENGSERITAIRDFINEWIYFSYADDNTGIVFPNQTLLYNYRDNSWAIFNETYTHYGTFRESTGQSWLAISTAWNAWNTPWNSGSTNLLQPDVIAGNQQGFIVFREGKTTEEEPSLNIDNIVGSIVTSANHGLNNGDFIYITNASGTVAPQVNDTIFQVSNVNTTQFTLAPLIAGGTYTGAGVITRLYRPFIQTKQFPAAWQMSRKTRLGPQLYLLTKTDRAQIQLLIFLSQNESDAWNNSPIVPDINSISSSLIYSTDLYTCRESTNLGLTPANTNLQQLTTIGSNGASANQQQQIWHRVNTSLIGDTIQIGFTMSDKQMEDRDDDGKFISQFAEIEINGIILDVNPSQFLA